jgi:hypothetical protein
MIRVVHHPGTGSRYFYPSRLQGVKKAPDHGSGSITLEKTLGIVVSVVDFERFSPDPDPGAYFRIHSGAGQLRYF